MARAKTIDVKPAEAKFVLEALYRDGVVSSEVMSEYRARYENEITTIETRLNYLRTLGLEAAAAVAGAAAAIAVPQVIGRIRQVPDEREATAGPGEKNGKRGPNKKGKAGSKGTRKSTRGASSESPERQAIRKLQGRYLVLLRQVPKGIKKRFGREAIQAKGKEAVVAEMEKHVASRPRKAGKK